MFTTSDPLDSRDSRVTAPENTGYGAFRCAHPPALTALVLATKVAIVMAMSSAAEHMALADVKNRLSEVVDRLEREHGRVVITKHGRPAAVVISIEDLEGLEETLDVLSDPKLIRRVRKAEAEVASGRAEELTREEALALIARQR
jgi:antitoxin YefM